MSRVSNHSEEHVLDEPHCKEFKVCMCMHMCMNMHFLDEPHCKEFKVRGPSYLRTM